MTSIRKVTILGAGAMGAAYAAIFCEAADFEVSFVADGWRYERLKRGVTVNGRHYPVAVVRPDEAAAPADLILVALKHHHLTGALPLIEGLVGDHTLILSVMNGLESEEMIGAVYGLGKLVYAIAVGIDAMREGECFTYANRGRIIFGPTPQTGAGRLARLGEALTRGGIPNQMPDDIRRAMWWKFMINVGINQASAVLRAPYGVFQNSPDARALMEMLMAEVIALAPKAGVDLTVKDLEEWGKVLSGLAPQGKTSMLQDIEAGNKTEVEIFAGKVVALGEQYGVPTPVNAAVLHIIKVLERNPASGK
ncbi:MAG: ketopantoate reductase family protein [Desulfobacteraceae bacterium]|nr:MAG: ketopantoate reductase family protein [Desulfobacteraceae bacterium]